MHKLQHSTQLNQMTTNNQLDGAAGIGAPLYVPATRHDLANICNGTKFPFVRSVILCLEDAIHKNDLPLALENISSLCSSKIQPKCQIFVRVANPEILATVCNFPGSEKISGFVLPKITAGNFTDYTSSIPQSSQYALMPTLETREVFSMSYLPAILKFFACGSVEMIYSTVWEFADPRARRSTKPHWRLSSINSSLHSVLMTFSFLLRYTTTSAVFRR